jgi:hypothetical protein
MKYIFSRTMMGLLSLLAAGMVLLSILSGPSISAEPLSIKGLHSTRKGSVNESDLLSADRISFRRNLIHDLHRAVAAGNYEQAAHFNAPLAQEAFQRAHKTLKAWETLRDPVTGLTPRSLRQRFWNGYDTAADCFPFMLLASHYLDKESESLWLHTLASERRLSGPLPRTMTLDGSEIIEESPEKIIFGGAEYAKDGLIYLTASLGKGPWFERMEEIIQKIVAEAGIKSSAGLIAADDAETNGDLLQVLSRLYWATRDERYITMAERITETYLFEIIPNNNGMPAMRWDFAAGKASSDYFKFRDHGNEILPGLSEVYFVEKLLNRPQAIKYREPLKSLLDKCLIVGRSPDGLWYDAVYTDTYTPKIQKISDNWGYILNAYRTFDLAEGTDIYSKEILRAMKAAAAMKSYPWESKNQDGYADSIESMLYQLSQFDVPECHLWVDDEIEVLFAKQLPSGFVDGSYLDGNFIRTSLMYAFYKTQGIMSDPWRDDLRFGTALDKSKKSCYLYLDADKPWQGLLKFDFARHKAYWNLPFNYPRLNAMPEWFIVHPDRKYGIKNLSTNKKTEHSGKALIEGYKIMLDGKSPALLRITLVSGE